MSSSKLGLEIPQMKMKFPSWSSYWIWKTYENIIPHFNFF